MEPPPALMDELVEECLLRLLPHDPATLVRTALVCKGWSRIVTDQGFCRRFREIHGRPPMLGFLDLHSKYGLFFTPTSSFRPRNAAYLRLGGWHAIDSRHGFVLLSRSRTLFRDLRTDRCSNLAVWEPISGELLDLPKLPPAQHHGCFGFASIAAVLCASSNACDHLDCHRGHFLVVFIDGTYPEMFVYVYSSRAGTWSHVTTAALDHSTSRLVPKEPVTIAGNALYFRVYKRMTHGILKYDMGAHEVSWVDLPPDCSRQSHKILLMTTEHGGLGIIRVEMNSRLHLWSREACPSGVLGWAPSRVIELETLLPANSGSVSTVSVVHGLGALFITTIAGGFTVDLLSNRVWKPLQGRIQLLVCQMHEELKFLV